ncbi:MAG: glycosyltransferase family 4 protein [Gemmatimonadota bacterium]
MADPLSCLLLGARGGGGEEVFLADLIGDPPDGVTYRAVLDAHASAPGARAQAWAERAFNRLVHPWLWPLPGLRAYRVDDAYDVVHVHNLTHRIQGSVPVVMSLGGATYRHYLAAYLAYSDERIRTLYARASRLYPPLGITNEFVSWERLAAIVVFSHYAAGHLKAAGVPSERVHVVPPGFSDPGVGPGPPPSPFRVVLAGRDPERKGADLALEAQRRLRGRGLEVELTLVGDPAYPDWTREGVMGLAAVPRERLFAILARAHALVVPSRAEGFGFVAVEAMACGRAVLVSDTAALPEIVGTGGQVVRGSGADPWVEALEPLVRDPELAGVWGTRARARFEETFTRAHFKARLRAVYESARSARGTENPS